MGNSSARTENENGEPSGGEKKIAVSRKGKILADFSFSESVYVRKIENTCWQTQEEQQVLEHFEVLPEVQFCVRPTYIVANHALAIYKIRGEGRTYYLVVELIPTGDTPSEDKSSNIVLNYVVLTSFPENVKNLASYQSKNDLFVFDLVEFGSEFFKTKGGVYDLLEHNCFHYVEHVLRQSCLDYDQKAIKDLEDFKVKSTIALAGVIVASVAIGKYLWNRRKKNAQENTTEGGDKTEHVENIENHK
jgi:hypothetical protein